MLKNNWEIIAKNYFQIIPNLIRNNTCIWLLNCLNCEGSGFRKFSTESEIQISLAHDFVNIKISMIVYNYHKTQANCISSIVMKYLYEPNFDSFLVHNFRKYYASSIWDVATWFVHHKLS